MENCKQLNARILKHGDSAADVVFALQAAPSSDEVSANNVPSHSDKVSSDSVKVAQRLLERLSDDRCVPAVETEIPLRRFLFELAMREAGKDSRGVVSMAKCKEIAQSFQIESVDDVLQYLSNRNLILYVPEVIPDLVFCDVQTPLNVIKQLAQYCAKVRADAEVKDIPRADLNPRNLEFLATHGALTDGVLYCEEFKNLFDDLFTPVECFKLLKHLVIIADQQSGGYFMPCILREMPENDVELLRRPSSNIVEPLLLYFSEWPLASVFCTLIARLVSGHDGWKPVPFHDEKQLYRNCIMFHELINDHYCNVILIESYDSGYFEVHLALAEGEPRDCLEELCPAIRSKLLEALQESKEFSSDFTVKDAFFCRCIYGPSHAAILEGSHLRCAKHSKTVRLCDADICYMWFGDADVSNPSKCNSPEASSILDDKPEPGDVISFKYVSKGSEQTFKLRKTFSSTWRDLGKKFGFSREELRAFATNNRDNPEQCFDDVISLWMDDGSKPPEAYPVTWAGLVMALEDVGGVNVKVDKLKMALKKKKVLLGKHKHPECSQSPSSTAATSSPPFTQASSPKRSRAVDSTDAAAASTASLQPPYLSQQTTVSPWQPAVFPRQPVSLHPAFSLPQTASLENVCAVPLPSQHVIPPAPTLQAAPHHPHPAGYTTYPVYPSGPTQYMPHPPMPYMAPSYPHPSSHHYHHSGGHPWPPPPPINYHAGPSGVSPSPYYYPATHLMAPSPLNYGPHYSNNPSNAQHLYFPSGSGALNPNPQAGQDQPLPFPSSSQYPGSWSPHQ